MRRVLLLSCLVLLAGCGMSEGPDVSAKAFYIAYIALPHDGIPEEPARAKLDPFLTQKLIGLLKSANRAEADYHKATKGEVPPLEEGDPFSSLFEGPKAAEIGNCTVSGQTAECPIMLSYSNPDGSSPVTWTDRAYLTTEGGAWKIDDIGYEAGFDFGNHGRLSEMLTDIVAQAKQPQDNDQGTGP